MKESISSDRCIRCAIYDRVSTELQAECGRSLETQRSDLDRYAREHGYIIVDHYADEGITARKKMQNRKDFLRLLSDVKKDKIDLILVTKLDRWFRNIRDYYATQEILEAHHCNWKTIYEDYDSSTADGQLKINIMLSVAQNECDRTSERIKAVFRHKVQLGEITTSSLIYFGYRLEGKHLIKDPEQAPIVKEVYRKFFETHSKQATYRHCLKKYGDLFSYQTFGHFFTSEIYVGKYRSNEHFCPPYLTPAQWEEIQCLNQKNIRLYSSAGAPSIYLFSGLLKCPVCGRTLSGTSVKTRSGRTNHYYRCWKHRCDHSCTYGSTISELRVERFLTENILLPLSPLSQIPSIRPKVPENQAFSASAYDAQLKRLNDLYIRGRLTESDYNRKYDAIKSRMECCIRSEADTGQEISSYAHLPDSFQKGWVTLYRELDSEHRRNFWQGFLSSVSFFENRLVRSVLFQRKV